MSDDVSGAPVFPDSLIAEHVELDSVRSVLETNYKKFEKHFTKNSLFLYQYDQECDLCW